MVRKKLNKKEVLMGIALTVLAMLVLIFYVWNQIESVRLGYKIGQLEERLISLKKEVEKLEAEKSSLLALDKVEKIAKQKLKMDKAKKEQIIYDEFSPNP